MKNKIILLSVACILGLTSQAQIKGIGDFFGSGADNAELLFKEYISPWTNAFGASLNGGWYNSAKVHELGGFDLTITFNTALVPDMDKTFDLTELGLQNVTFPEGSETATVAGARNGGKTITYTPEPSYPNASVDINAPNGVGVGFIPLPTLKLGVGLIKSTEIDIRYMPDVNLMDFGKIGMWGVGIKHDIKQWIPVLEKVPIFQLSVQAGYTKFSSDFNINITPEVYNLTGTGDYDNQHGILDVNSFTANILVGANLPVVGFYGGLGFATTNANLALTGNYPIPTVNTSGDLTVMDVENPIDVKMTNSDGSKTKPRVNAGIRIKMGIIIFHGDYTYANYSVATVGIGISFR